MKFWAILKKIIGVIVRATGAAEWEAKQGVDPKDGGGVNSGDFRGK